MNAFEEEYKGILKMRKKAKKRIEKTQAFLDETEIWVSWAELIEQVVRLQEQLKEMYSILLKQGEAHRISKRELAIKHYRLRNREAELEELGELKPPRRITQVSAEDEHLNILDPVGEEE